MQGGAPEGTGWFWVQTRRRGIQYQDRESGAMELNPPTDPFSQSPSSPINPGNPGGNPMLWPRPGETRTPDISDMDTATYPEPDTRQPEPGIEQWKPTWTDWLRTLADGPLSPSAMLQKLGARVDCRNIANLAAWLRNEMEADGYVEAVQYRLTRQGTNYLRDHPESQ
jgi:hypothetical protein